LTLEQLLAASGTGGGGSTTLRVYSAWISEADQKAAGALNLRMPAPPFPLNLSAPADGLAASDSKPRSPYQHITADLRGAIACGALRPGEPLPTVEQLKDRYQVSAGTVNRAVAELKQVGLITASRGRRATVSVARHGQTATKNPSDP